MERKKKDILMKFRLTSDEKQSFEEAANLAGLDLSAWVRTRLRNACRQEMMAEGKEPSFARSE